MSAKTVDIHHSCHCSRRGCHSTSCRPLGTPVDRVGLVVSLLLGIPRDAHGAVYFLVTLAGPACAWVVAVVLLCLLLLLHLQVLQLKPGRASSSARVQGSIHRGHANTSGTMHTHSKCDRALTGSIQRSDAQLRVKTGPASPGRVYCICCQCKPRSAFILSASSKVLLFPLASLRCAACNSFVNSKHLLHGMLQYGTDC